MVIGAVTKGSQRCKRTYEMVKRLKCFQRFRVRKGARTFRKRFQSLPKYLWPFRVQKGMGNSEAVPKWHFQNETSEAPEPLCGSRLNTVTLSQIMELIGSREGWEHEKGCCHDVEGKEEVELPDGWYAIDIIDIE